MGTPAYSLDLRTRIVESYKAGNTTIQKIAKLFSVSPGVIEKYIQQERETGDLSPLPRLLQKGATRNNPLVQSALLSLVQEHNDWTLAQYCHAIEEKCNIHMSISAMCGLLKQLNQRRKKKISMPRNATRQSYYRPGKNSVRKCN